MINTNVDSEGIATLEWDLPGRSQNVLNEQTMAAFADAAQKALADTSVKGILVASAKADFIAGGDLDMLLKATDAQAMSDNLKRWHKLFRTLETTGKPVAAALNGTTLGGGLEVALACHYRVAADNPKARFGFPEVTLGLLPGAGGTQRALQLFGIRVHQRQIFGKLQLDTNRIAHLETGQFANHLIDVGGFKMRRRHLGKIGKTPHNLLQLVQFGK